MNLRISFLGGLIISIVVFVGFLLTILIFTLFQPRNLVEKNYYSQGLAYQNHIDSVQRTNRLQEKPGVNYTSKGVVSITFPVELLKSSITGTLLLFRPSNDRLDRSFSLDLGNTGSQHIAAPALKPGYWRAQLTWQMEGQDYYTENVLIVG